MAWPTFRKRITKFSRKSLVKIITIVGELGSMMECVCRQETAVHIEEFRGPMHADAVCMYVLDPPPVNSLVQEQPQISNIFGLKYLMVELRSLIPQP